MKRQRSLKIRIILMLLCAAMVLSCSIPALAAESATAQEIIRLGTDKATQGHWAGKYGADAAILFGYAYTGNRTPTNDYGRFLIGPGNNVNLLIQSENSSLNNYSYQCYGALHCYNKDDDSILDMPAGSENTKFLAGAYCGGRRDETGFFTSKFTLDMKDEGYHVVTIYGCTAANSAFSVAFEKNGTEVFRDTLPKDTFKNGEYISYLLPGSVTVYIHAPNVTGASGIFVDDVSACGIDAFNVASDSASAAAKLTWSETSVPSGAKIIVEKEADNVWTEIAELTAPSSGSYLDNDVIVGNTYSYRLRTVNGTAYSLPTEVKTCTITAPLLGTDVFRLGTDKTTCGHWEGKYGSTDAAILFGYAYTGEHGPKNGQGRFMISRNQYDYVSKASDSSLTSYDVNNSGALWCYDESDDSILDMPSGSENQKFLCGAFHYATADSLFKLNLKDEAFHVITLYGSKKMTGDFTLTFEKNGEAVLTDTLPEDTFAGGGYVSYLVLGSVTIRLKKTAPTECGLSAIFIDKVAAFPTGISDFALSAGDAARSVKLTWAEQNLPTGITLVLDRKIEEGEWAEFARLQAGVCEYLDSDLASGTTYSYRLRTLNGTSYSAYNSILTYAVPAYQNTTLTFDKTLYTAKDSTVAIEANVTLLDQSNAGCANQTVELTADWGHDTQSIGTAQTDSDGIAAFTFYPAYLGEATLTAAFADNDDAKLSHSSATASAYVGEVDWQRAPIIYKISDAVLPGDLVNINGYGFHNEDMTKLAVKYAPHTSDTVSAEPPAEAADMEIVQTDARDGFYVVAELPAGAAAGLYDIWVTNGYGYAEPVTLNAARPLFISEYEAWDGQAIKISGRNLLAGQFGADLKTKVRLTNGTNSYEQTLVKNTPYSIAFAVNAPLGTYNVEVSNDNGITWRGLITDQTLTVVSKGNDPLDIGVAWMGDFAWDNVFDITDYGANGTNTEDDTEAVNAAIAAARASEAQGGVIYFPNGNYYVGSLKIPANIVMRGESTDGTTLYYNGTGGNMFESTEDGQTIGHQGFANFSIRLSDDNTRPDAFFWLGHAWGSVAHDQVNRQPTEFFIKNIDLSYSMESIDQSKTAGSGQQRGLAVVAIIKERYLVQDTSFSGEKAGCNNVYVNEYGGYTRVTCNYDVGYLQCSAKYNFTEDCRVTGGLRKSGTRENHGIFARAFAHVENNYVECVGSRQNDGETYCCEMPGGYFNYGEIINATKNSITVTPDVALKDSYALSYGRLMVRIIDGRGLGQQLEVESVDSTANTIILKGEWDVIPDRSSKFSLFLPLEYVTFFNNTSCDSTKGIYLYGNIYDAVAANNIGIDTEGIFVFSANGQYNGRDNQSSFVTIRENKLSGISPISKTCNISFHSQRQANGPEYYCVDIYGMEVRDNQITAERGAVPVDLTEAPEGNGIVSFSGINSSQLGSTVNYHGDTTNILIENNLIKDADTAITSKKYDYGLVLKGNIFDNVGEETEIETAENVAVRNMTATKAILDSFISVWEKASSKNYTEESFKALTDALAAAKAISADSNATQTAIALALQELRIASGSLVWVIAESANPVEPIDPIDPIDPTRPAIPSYIPAVSDSKFPFKDVGRSDAFYDAVKYLYENNIMNGTSRTEFSPNAELTRGMVVTILYRMEAEPSTSGAKPLSDVKTGLYYSKAVDWAAEKNIVNGFSDGTFKPEQLVTREQLATIISRYAVSKGIAVYEAANALASTDVVSAWARSNVAWAAAEGILTKTQTTNTTKNATRAEVATAIYTYLTKTAK